MTKKYIRTEDRIYEFEKVKTRKFLQIGNTSKEVELDEDESIFPYPIIKQADNIEELSDYFFHLTYNADNDNYEINYWGKANELNKYLKDYKEELKFGIGIGEDKLFLAILTDKGLVFVAKMNKKGEIELL